MLKMTIDNAYQLEREMERCGRNYYTREAYEIMIDYFEEFEVEFDAVAICCDFDEEDFAYFVEQFGIDTSFIKDVDNPTEEEIEAIIEAYDYNYASAWLTHNRKGEVLVLYMN